MAKGKNPPAPKTIDFNVATLKNIFRLAVDLDLIAKSPAVRVPIPKLPPKREKWIELEDALKVLDAVAGTELDAPVFLAMVLGLRRGEVAGLKWTDIDRQARTVRITRQRIGTTGQNVVERELKTSSSRRTLILPQNLMDGIDQRGNLDSQYVATYKNEPWVPDTIGEKWKKMAKRLGMEDWHFHDLRGQAAKLMAAAGANILEIAAVLGHNKPDMTLLYAVHRESQGETALERLGELLTSERNGTG